MKLLKNFIAILMVLAALFFSSIVMLWLLVTQPSSTTNQPSAANVDPARLKAHVSKITTDFYPRNYRRHQNLLKCAEYIKEEFENALADSISIQYFGKPPPKIKKAPFGKERKQYAGENHPKNDIAKNIIMNFENCKISCLKLIPTV